MFLQTPKEHSLKYTTIIMFPEFGGVRGSEISGVGWLDIRHEDEIVVLSNEMGDDNDCESRCKRAKYTKVHWIDTAVNFSQKGELNDSVKRSNVAIASSQQCNGQPANENEISQKSKSRADVGKQIRNTKITSDLYNVTAGVKQER